MQLPFARLTPAATQHRLSNISAQALINFTHLAYKAKEIPLASQKQGCGRKRLYAANDMHFCFNSTTDDVDTSQSIYQPGYYERDSVIETF